MQVQPVILEMREIDKSFAGTHALKELSFTLRRGEVHALLGENGAGKSTLIKVLGGIYQPDKGTISIDGKTVRMDKVHVAQSHGIGIIHQEIVLVPHLTVAENIFLGREPTTGLGLKDGRAVYKRAREMMQSLDLDIDVHTKVAELSIAQQQMVEIVKAISFNVKILVMDEPTSSLSDKEVETLFKTIRRLKEQQVSIIYISHRMEELFAISDRVTVIRDGTYVGTKNTAGTTADELVGMMVGRNLENYYVRDYQEPGDEVLSVRHLTKRRVFEDVSFTVRRGEILGFSGLVGAGRSEIMLALFGADSYDSGQVLLEGKPVRFRSAAAAIRHNVALIPEDRKKQGLILVASVAFNLTLAGLDNVIKNGFISAGRRREQVRELIGRLGVKTASAESAVQSLSGGNQQKVLVGKWLATNPRLLILDEPTRGVDVGSKQEIYSIINELAKEGMAIILVSSDLPEIINMCDAVCVVREGRLAAKLDRRELTQENIMKHATLGGQEL